MTDALIIVELDRYVDRDKKSQRREPKLARARIAEREVRGCYSSSSSAFRFGENPSLITTITTGRSWSE
jgi:hypothetical protein